MKKKLLLPLYILAVVLAGMFIVNEVGNPRDVFGTERQIKYTMYVGLNDKDTNEQVYGFEEAKQAMFLIVSKFTGGCTFYDAQGYWYDDEQKKIYSENTLVCVFFDAEPETIKNIMDEAIKVLNQSSILLETEEVRRVFYSAD